MPHHELQTIHHMQEIQRQQPIRFHCFMFIESCVPICRNNKPNSMNKKAENNAVMLFFVTKIEHITNKIYPFSTSGLP